MNKNKKIIILITFLLAIVLIIGGCFLSFCNSPKEGKNPIFLGLWKMSHLRLTNGYEVDYQNQDYSDTYYYFTKDKVTIFRLSSGIVILEQERFYRFQEEELLMSKTADFKNLREYEFTPSSIVARKVNFSDDIMTIVEEQEDLISTETYERVEDKLVKELKENYNQYVKELHKNLPE